MKPPYAPNQVVGNFTIIKCMSPKTGSGLHRVYLARCNHCGSEKYYRSSVLPKQEGCGCTALEKNRVRSTRHGHYYERLYRIWTSMIQRCENKNSAAYRIYGARGIAVCQQWHDYETFYRWAIYSGYRQSLSLERKDVNNDYCPENCTWVTMRAQAQNKRNSVRDDKGKSLKALMDAGDKKAIRAYGLKVWARAIKKRADFQCEICGCRPAPEFLDAHHWYATKAHVSNTDLLLCNGICLCRRCHIDAHIHVAEYKTKIMKLKRLSNFASKMDTLMHERFDINKAFEAIQRCRKILKEKEIT